MFAGSRLECARDCATSSPAFNFATTIAENTNRTLTFDATVPAGTTTGL